MYKQVYMRLSQATTINVCMYLTKEFGFFLESFDKRKIVFKCGFVFFGSKTHSFFVSFSTTRQDVVKVSQFKNLLLFIVMMIKRWHQ